MPFPILNQTNTYIHMSGKMFLINKNESQDWMISTKEDGTDMILRKSRKYSWSVKWEYQGTWYRLEMNPAISEEREQKCRNRNLEWQMSRNTNLECQKTGSVEVMLAATLGLSMLLIGALVGAVIFMQRRYAR